MTKISEHLEIIIKGSHLNFAQAQALLDAIFEGNVPEEQIAAFLTAMKTKGETAEEIAGFAKSLRKHVIPVKVKIENLVDTCGTGGAKIKTFNISTAAALVAAGSGVYIAKHGNRGITSKCGSADVLAQLGVKIDASAEVVAECIEQAHIGFMFAPMFHPAMKYVQPVRKRLEFRTVFNILGPLANPAGAAAHVMGVADESLIHRIAEVHKILGSKRVMVVHSRGLDEISTLAATIIYQLSDGNITPTTFNPTDVGISFTNIEILKGGDAAVNAKIVYDIICGKDKGPRKDIVLLNAAAAIIVAGLSTDFLSAIKIANDSIVNGKAVECLEKLIKISNSNQD